ncbi:hypothetical protein [Terasakiella pusilla]|uniref:hypothetical protein n=1 Tax=Terasakiella pusilla TaxID=64973 RepID=UPI003AA8CDC0
MTEKQTPSAKPQAQAKATPKTAPRQENNAQSSAAGKETLYVVDTTCQPNAPYNVRQHEVMEGNGRIVAYDFKYNEATPMPAGHARRFLHIPQFKIYEDESLNTLVPTVSKADSNADKKGVQLQPGQVIARLDELSTEALFNRCCQYAGSETLGQASDRTDAIAFLRAQYGVPSPQEPSEDDLDLEMDPDELDGLIG